MFIQGKTKLKPDDVKLLTDLQTNGMFLSIFYVEILFSAELLRIASKNFENKILHQLCASYMHVFGFLHLNKWVSIRVSEGRFVAKCKNFSGDIVSWS